MVNSSLKKLYKIYLKYRLISIDTRTIKVNSIFFALKGNNHNGLSFVDEAIYKGAILVVIDDYNFKKKNNKFIDKVFLVKNTLSSLHFLALYHRNSFLSIPLIAITGSNGKTTTKELLVSVLSMKFNVHSNKGNLNNHLGVPLTILSTPLNTDIIVLELGASKLKEIYFLCKISKPDYGYITNFGYAHIKGFKNFNGVVLAKTELYKYLKINKKKVFINSDDLIQVLNSKNISKFSFSTKNKSDVYIKKRSNKFFSSIKLLFKKEKINSKLIGEYNVSNICSSIAIGYYFGLSPKEIKFSIESYIPKNNRSQIIKKNGKIIILDAYNANLTSMKESILNFNENIGFKIAIIGDMNELGNIEFISHKYIINLLIYSNINLVFLIGNIFSSFNFDFNYKKIFFFKTKNDLIFYIKKNSMPLGFYLLKASRTLSLEDIVYYL